MTRPRIRTLKPECHQDERLVGTSMGARVLYIGLVTQADDEGRQSGNLALLRSRVFPFDVTLEPGAIASWLDELEAADMVERYEHDGRSYVSITSWSADQKIDRPTASALPAPPSQDDSTEPREDSRGLANDRPGPDQDRDPDQDQEGTTTSRKRADEEARQDVDELCGFMADRIRANDSGAKVDPTSNAWRREMRLLLDADDRELEEVRAVIGWVHDDDFERTVVLSPAKLRKRFTALLLKARGASGGTPTAFAGDFSRFDAIGKRSGTSAEDFLAAGRELA